MIISHKYKFIFVKTRKTAGSSIEKYLVDYYLGPDDICTGSKHDGTPLLNNENLNGHLVELPANNGHLGWQWIKENYTNEWDQYYKFAVDRNPWDKMVSTYYWWIHSKPHILFKQLGSSKAVEVSKGFEHRIMNSKLDLWDDWPAYSDSNGPVVDQMLTYENLHEKFLDLPIPYNNELQTTFVKSGLRPNQPYQNLYTEEMQQRVRDNFSQMIDYFQFEF